MTVAALAAFAFGGALVGFALATILTAWAVHDTVAGRKRTRAWYTVVNWWSVLAILGLFTIAGVVLAVGLDGLLELAGWWP